MIAILHCEIWLFVADPGVPYTVTVRASTAVGIGEPVSIIVFSMQQGNVEQITMCILLMNL